VLQLSCTQPNRSRRHWSKIGHLRDRWDPHGVTHVTGLMQFGLETASKQKEMQGKVTKPRAVGYV